LRPIPLTAFHFALAFTDNKRNQPGVYVFRKFSIRFLEDGIAAFALKVNVRLTA
jgi:hypothetical protein